MVTDTASGSFADFALLTEAIRALTVAQAKALIKDVNNEPEAVCGRLALSGNKPEIINRLITSITERKNQGDIRGYQKFRSFILRYKSPSVAAHSYQRAIPTADSSTYGGINPAGGYAAYGQRLGGIPTNKVSSIASSSYSPAASAGAPSSRPIGSAGAARINFRASPFYEIKSFVSPIVQCPEAPTQADRKNATLFVNLTGEQAELLKGSKHQLRLFCTTVEAHAASLSGRNPATVEFPLTCEARVNTHTLSINLRGSKKNAGRVPPPNLNKDGMLALRDGRPNRIDLTYTNAPKRHVLVAAMCEITSVETLVDRLKSQQFRSKDDVLSRMRKEAEDDDIEAGAATMSLKCPFSYMRIATPCRSIHCSHVQCFDAYSFFSVNEQTPSWACPICHKPIKVDELIMDGYVDDILKRVPQDTESVVVEPDGAWRTSDGKVSSTGTAQATPAAEGTPLQERLLGGETEDVKPAMGGVKSNGIRRTPMDEIVLLDSPSPPPQSAAVSAPATSSAAPALAPMPNGSAAHVSANAPRPVPPPVPPVARHERIELLSSSTNTSAGQSPAAGTGAGTGDVIDLTLDSDDEGEASVPNRPAASNGAHNPAHTHPSGASSGGASGARAGFAHYAKNVATPHRTGPFAAVMARAEATPEDEQIRRPGKRARVDEMATPADPRLANGRRAGSASGAMPSSYLDMGASGAAGARAVNGGSPSGASRTGANGGAYREPQRSTGGEDDDNAWMETADTNEHEQYLNEDDWWSPGA